VRAFADRIYDANAKVPITADSAFRWGKVIGLKRVADEAIGAIPSIKTTMAVRHAGNAVGSETTGWEIRYDESSNEQTLNVLLNQGRSRPYPLHVREHGEAKRMFTRSTIRVHDGPIAGGGASTGSQPEKIHGAAPFPRLLRRNCRL
jgi:hypothetical protein